MSADLGAAGSSHSHLSDPLPIGAEEPTVVRTPGMPSGSSASGPAFVTAPGIHTKPTVSPTLKRLFDLEASPFGLRLAEFVVEERIGVGGMGAVFKAHDTRLSRKVALKVLSPNATLDEQLVSRFHNEARATARLSHDNIARVYSSGQDLGVHFIAYELIDGTNLRDLIMQCGMIKPAETLSYAIQIAMALNHTAAAGVVHRDIKPSNIIITPEGRARVVDLGLARRDGDDSIADLTVAGSTLGTFDYISPEQAQDPRNVDVRSDIYSLGCTMFHMLTGKPPYPEGTALQKLLDHKGKDAPVPHDVNRRVPRDLSGLVQRMMASDPAERYPTPALLVEDLMRIAARMGLKGIQPEGLVWKTARETRPPFLQANLGWIIMGTLLMLVAVFLRLQPQSLDTDFRSQGLRVASPTATAVDTDTDTAATDRTADPRATDAAIALIETLWPEEPYVLFAGTPGETQSGSNATPTAAVSSGLQGLLAPLWESFRRSLRVKPEERMAEADATQPDTTGNPSPGNSPRISLQSDPDKVFPTLEAACWAAQDGDVVVVRADTSNTPLIEKPIRVVKKSITILGEPAGGRVPLVRFDIGVEPSDIQSRMMTIIGGDVRIANMDIEVIARPEVGTDRWVLCALEGADRVRLDKVNVDFRNEQGLDAAVFEVTLGADAALARMQNAAPGEYEVRLNGCLVRGDTRLFHIETALAGSLEVVQSGISLNRTLLSVVGTNDTLAERDRIDLELNHATCQLAEGLVRMSNVDPVGGSTMELMPVHIESENSILASRSDAPLVRMAGTSAPEEFRTRLVWNGTRNLYDGFDVFWQIDSTLTGLGVQDDGFDVWKEYWTTNEDAGEVGAIAGGGKPWLSDRWRQREASTATLADFRLDATKADSEAIGGATDGSNLGVNPDELRRLPTSNQ